MALGKKFKTLVLLLVLLISLSSSLDYENESNEIISQGRIQYQLLRERGNLPKYGECWKSAIQTVDEGCRELSEETQSEIALSLSNCFLDMSGLETYHCETDKKRNVRGICISSMSDKAFNVYTEFYTHTLNMCWFLRGQIWQETISENTLKVGKQLEYSAVKQEKLLQIQKESLEVQEQMLEHGRTIENVLSDLSDSTQNHQEMLMLMSTAISSLQSWVVGEVSWVNTLLFYISFGFFIIILTSTPRTVLCRLPLLTILIFNVFTERLLCKLILGNTDLRKTAADLYGDIDNWVQLLRYCFIVISVGVFLFKTYLYEDATMKCRSLLDTIYKQNVLILEQLEKTKYNQSSMDETYSVYKINYMEHLEERTPKKQPTRLIERQKIKRSTPESTQVDLSNFIVSTSTLNEDETKPIIYNLRSRQNTPNI